MFDVKGKLSVPNNLQCTASNDRKIDFVRSLVIYALQTTQNYLIFKIGGINQTFKIRELVPKK